jgi:hypothetical protein
MSRRWRVLALAPIIVVLAACSSAPQSAPSTTTTGSPQVRIVLRTGQSCPDAVQWLDLQVSTHSLPPGSTSLLAINCTAKELTAALRSLHPKAATATAIRDLAVFAEDGVCPTQPTLKLCASGGWSKTITPGST